jgi:hypothetical protein
MKSITIELTVEEAWALEFFAKKLGQSPESMAHYFVTGEIAKRALLMMFDKTHEEKEEP